MSAFYKKNILGNNWILLMFIIPMFMPQSFAFFFDGIIEKQFIIWNALNSIILFLIFVSKKKIIKVYSWGILIFWIMFLITSLIVSDDLKMTFNTWVGIALPIINFILLGNILLGNSRFKHNYGKYINLLYIYFFFLLTFNFILILIFPAGIVGMEHVFTSGQVAENLKRVNFMATDNTTIQFLITTILLSELKFYLYKKNQFSRIYVWVISGLTSIILWSATGLVGYFIFLGTTFLFIVLRQKKWYLSINMAFFWGITLFFIIVVFRLMSMFSIIIVYLLGKDISLTNRTDIWDLAFSKISQYPWLGWGNNGKGWIIEHNWYLYYSHNLILDVLIQGGIVTLLCLFFLLNYSRLFLKRQPDRKLESIFACSIIALFTMNITESHFTSIYFYIPFILAWLLSIYLLRNKERKLTNALNTT